MSNKIQKFIKLPSEEKRLFIEAYVMLGIMRAAILTISFKRLTQSLKHLPKQEKIISLNDTKTLKAMIIGQSITRAAAYTPWESSCLVQSLTAQKMLEKRSIPGLFYLGVMKDKENKEEIKAHAWTQCGEDIIIGVGGHKEYTVISVFGWVGK